MRKPELSNLPNRSHDHERALRVRTSLRAGGPDLQHSERALRVRTSLRAGGPNLQHSERALRVRTRV